MAAPHADRFETHDEYLGGTWRGLVRKPLALYLIFTLRATQVRWRPNGVHG